MEILKSSTPRKTCLSIFFRKETIIQAILFLACCTYSSSAASIMYMNFQKLALYYHANTNHYELLLLPLGENISYHNFDYYNTEIILVTKDSRHVSINNENIHIYIKRGSYVDIYSILFQPIISAHEIDKILIVKKISNENYQTIQDINPATTPGFALSFYAPPLKIISRRKL